MDSRITGPSDRGGYFRALCAYTAYFYPAGFAHQHITCLLPTCSQEIAQHLAGRICAHLYLCGRLCPPANARLGSIPHLLSCRFCGLPALIRHITLDGTRGKKIFPSTLVIIEE